MKRQIWSCFPKYEEWEEYFDEYFPTYSTEERKNAMYSFNEQDLEIIRENLHVYAGDILVIAGLGLWDGRRNAYRVIQDAFVSDCLYSRYQPEWYLDGDLICAEHHHDGTNYLRYRVFKEQCGERARETLFNHILSGELTQAELTRKTKSLLPMISKVYGF